MKFEQQPILVGRIFHPGRSHECCSGGALPCGRYLPAPLIGNEEGGIGFMVLRVRPTPARFPTTILLNPVEQNTRKLLCTQTGSQRAPSFCYSFHFSIWFCTKYTFRSSPLGYTNRVMNKLKPVFQRPAIFPAVQEGDKARETRRYSVYAKAKKRVTPRPWCHGRAPTYIGWQYCSSNAWCQK